MLFILSDVAASIGEKIVAFFVYFSEIYDILIIGKGRRGGEKNERFIRIN